MDRHNSPREASQAPRIQRNNKSEPMMSLSYTTPPARGSSAAAEAGTGRGPRASSTIHPSPGGLTNQGHRSAAAPAPREGLPPCVTIALFENRLATMVDAEADCPHGHYAERFIIGAGVVLEREDEAHNSHGFQLWTVTRVLEVRTDDEAEAEAAWERAERWVRTGVLDD